MMYSRVQQQDEHNDSEIRQENYQNDGENGNNCPIDSSENRKPYRPWTRQDTATVKKYFSSCIMSTENVATNKGSLPNVKELHKFLVDFPHILRDCSNSEKIKRLRSKVFNERKLTREKMRKTGRSDRKSYRPWTRQDTATVNKYFSSCILSTENVETNKGSLPNVKELHKFLVKFPHILRDCSKPEKIKRLRSKVFNERKLMREKMRKTVESDRKPYRPWTRQATATVKKYFSSCILSTENVETNKGSLPNVKELHKFLVEFPHILRGCSKPEKIKRLRSKVFNERKLTRQNMRKTVRSDRKAYRPWTRQDTATVKKYFSNCILSTENVETNKGSLPNIKILHKFLVEFPHILRDCSKPEKIKRLRSKVFNERKLMREKMRKTVRSENQLSRKDTRTYKYNRR